MGGDEEVKMFSTTQKGKKHVRNLGKNINQNSLTKQFTVMLLLAGDKIISIQQWTTDYNSTVK